MGGHDLNRSACIRCQSHTYEMDTSEFIRSYMPVVHMNGTIDYFRVRVRSDQWGSMINKLQPGFSRSESVKKEKKERKEKKRSFDGDGYYAFRHAHVTNFLFSG